MSNKFEKHIQLEKTQTIIDCLSDNVELSKQQLKKIMQNGALWLENSHGINRVRRAKKIVHKNDQLHLYYDESIQLLTPSSAGSSTEYRAELISDEGDYSIWNKPAGMYSQGTKWGDHCTVYRWAEKNLLPQRQAFIVHRLDKAANGLIIIAHKKTTAAQFSKMFEQREINKKYRAVVEGLIDDLVLPFEIRNELDDKIAISEIVSLSLDKNKNQTTVEIKIQTGRKHQIRRHLSDMGFAIVGDRLYGTKPTQQNLQLSSVELEFICPLTLKQMKYNLPINNANDI